MSLLQAVILAVIQGITEFLPVSSSAHLALAPWLFGWPDQGLLFDVALHIGTLLAVLAYFSRDWLQVFAQGFGLSWGSDPMLKQNRSILWLLAVGSIPAGVVGLLIEEYAETTLRTPYVIGTMLVLVAVLMAYAEMRGRHTRTIGDINWTDALLIGAAQSLALIPGTSRSGITMTTALLRGIDRHSAARYSFLLSTPITAAAALKKMYDLYQAGGVPPDLRNAFFVGILISAITGSLVISFLLRYLRRYTLRPFIYYRVVFGGIILALAVFYGYSAR